MAFCELKYFSESLQKATAANILLPETKTKGPYPVFYLLHGLSDDHSGWQRRTSIEQYVRDLPLIVVMPDAGRSFYSDAIAGFAYESALIRDLMEFVDRTFPTLPTREGRCVGGLSMGGYGAVKFALKYPDLFCSAVSHSGALRFANRPLRGEHRPDFDREFARVVGENPVGGANDLFALSEQLSPKKRPALRIDCGTEDFLLNDNREFHAHLEKIGFAHEYEEFAGDHNWSYWDIHVQEAISFHLRSLQMPGAMERDSA